MRVIRPVIYGAIVFASLGWRLGAEEPAPPAGAAQALSALADAFNRHDAQAAAAQWSPDAVHESSLSADRLSGREAIAKAYAELFRADPKAEMKLHAGPGELVADGEALVSGTIEVRHGDGSVTTSRVAARLVETKEGWRIQQVRELMAPPRPSDALAPLEWLVGSWVDESPQGRVTNDVEWTRGRSFLTRAYRQEAEGKVVREGRQLIGWDAEDQCLRCWTFDNDGSFGEGVLEPDGENRWLSRMIVKLADGRRGSMTQVLEKLPDGTMKIESLARDVDGEPQPNGAPVTMRRANSLDRKKS